MKINVSNKEKINTAIKGFEGNLVSVRTLDADMVESMVERIEEKLSCLLLKKDWINLRFKVDYHAQSFPGSYNGTPESTQFTLERFRSGWFVVDINRDFTRFETQVIIPVNLDTKQKEVTDFVKQPSKF
jgi:hypothetical protein